MKKSTLILYWAARLIAVIILIQTLYFKFTGAPESVYIFTTIGMEPWGRIGVGIMEMIAAVMLLFNATVWFGSALAFGLMLGAIGMHLTILGISVEQDGGYLFFLAVIVTVCSAYVLWKNKNRIITLFKLRRASIQS
jgi:hypothetical protein